MRKPTSPKSYAVGYKKPPTASQFKKGVSGNPSGRPRKICIGLQVLREELNSKITVEIDGVKRKLSKERIFYRQLINTAVKQNNASSRHLIPLLKQLSLMEAMPSTDPSVERINNMTDEQLDAAIKELEESTVEHSNKRRKLPIKP